MSFQLGLILFAIAIVALARDIRKTRREERRSQIVGVVAQRGTAPAGVERLTSFISNR